MRTTITIELKMDVSDDPEDGQQAAIEAITIQTAQLYFAQAILCAGKRKPQMRAFLENNSLGMKELKLPGE